MYYPKTFLRQHGPGLRLCTGKEYTMLTAYVPCKRVAYVGVAPICRSSPVQWSASPIEEHVSYEVLPF